MGKSESDVSKKSEKKKSKIAKEESEDDIPVVKSKSEKKRKNSSDLEEVYVASLVSSLCQPFPHLCVSLTVEYIVCSKEPKSKKSKAKEEEISSEETDVDEDMDVGTSHSAPVSPFPLLHMCFPSHVSLSWSSNYPRIFPSRNPFRTRWPACWPRPALTAPSFSILCLELSC